MTAIACMAMVLALPLILGTVGYNWLQAQRADLQHQVDAVTETANKTADKLDDVGERLAIVSAKQERNTASVGRFQKKNADPAGPHEHGHHRTGEKRGGP